eukprot:m.708594 g.708594  ORF g.708594 m.708594 type:complete len:154 (-) comp58746_c0_seq7:127-588(-)
MWAAGSGHTESVRVLLEFGADASLVNLQGQTALDYAHEGRKRELIAVLEDHARFLAQLGSHTKPAVREHPQAQEEDARPQEEASELINLHDQQAVAASIEDADAEPFKSENVGLPISVAAKAENDERSEKEDQSAASRLPALDLRDLDFQLPE